MTEEEILRLISINNGNLEKYQEKLRQIKQEIDEAENALANARKYEAQFYESIERRKSKGASLLSGKNQMKFLKGFCSQLNELLNGKPYREAESSIQDTISKIKNNILELNDEYDKYKGLIAKTKNSLSNYEIDLAVCRESEDVK